MPKITGPKITEPKITGVPLRPQSRVDRRVQELRARVLEAASELFETNGIEATKLDDICLAADVAKRTLFNHFPAKADIVGALAREAISQLVIRIDNARVSGKTTRARLALLFAAMGEYTTEQGPVHRESVGAFFQAAHGTADGAEGGIRISEALLALLVEGGTKELPRGCKPETFAELILGSIYCTTLEWIHREDYDVDAHLQDMSKLLTGMLRKP